jgi:polyisoprenoid-binding protein YceI
MKRILSIALALLLSTLGASSQTSWKIDRAHSRVSFSVTHLVVAEITGSFTDFEGTLVTSKEDLTDAKITATIKTASVNTDNEFRDKHLRSDDFFNADSFPTMTFVSTGVEKTGADTYKIAGNLTIRNITKPVMLDAKYKGQITAGGNTKAAFKATTTIDRFEFGTKWNKMIEAGSLVVGKNVEVTLLMEFNKQPGEQKGK